MTLTIYEELEQGSDEWHSARCGLMTCSELSLILTPTLKISDSEQVKKHVYELAAQRINNYVEPTYIGDNMIRGWEDEITARELYTENYAPVREIGGMVRDFGGYSIWCSPDGLVGEDGGIEAKSRIQKYQVQTISTMEVPKEHWLQVQGALAVSGRDWWDFISFSGGMPMCVIRAEPDEKTITAIRSACESFEEKIQKVIEDYRKGLTKMGKVIKTERKNRDLEVY